MEENGWKENFERMAGVPQDFTVETKVVPLHVAIGMVTALLNAERDSMRRKAVACVPEPEERWDEAFEGGFACCRKRALSALSEL